MLYSIKFYVKGANDQIRQLNLELGNRIDE